MENQETEGLRQSHYRNEQSRSDPCHNKSGDGGNIGQHIEQYELPNIRVGVNPTFDACGMLRILGSRIVSHRRMLHRLGGLQRRG
jgi:hypothetical protein